ncbi:MAG: hypothetical protein WCH34_11410 [Bacteroidota bacterium]
MNPPFFYQVNGTVFRTKCNETNLIEIDEIFKDNNPILARERAFNCYQNYIDVFLESKEKAYKSHDETVVVLQDFFNSYKKGTTIFGDEINNEIDVDYDKRLDIYLVMSDSKVVTNDLGENIFIDKHLIHSISRQFTDIKIHLYHGLRVELFYYDAFGYDYKNYKREFIISGLFDDPLIKSVLETPIDFSSVLTLGNEIIDFLAC